MSLGQDPYTEFLASRSRKVFYRVPYPGNAGDSLIQFATQKLLDDSNVRTTVDPRDADVILIPGGNPTMWPSIGPERWRQLWQRYPQAEFIVGPAGFRRGYADWSKLINEEGHRVSALFARDPESDRNLRSAGLRPDIICGLSHDPALSLRQTEWLTAHRRAATSEYDLAALRDDHEADVRYAAILQQLRPVLPQSIHSRIIHSCARSGKKRRLAMAARLLGKGASLYDNDVSRQRFEVFVETIRAARAVHTDRLHVMLMAAMLGKKVYAYPTAHGKLESVYRHSLAGWADVTIVSGV